MIATAEDAPGAVDAALREQPHLALLDVNMPGSGLAAAWEITARLPGTRVVMLTISRDDGHLFAALRAGAAGYLLKDTETERLPDALRDVMAGEAALPVTLVTRLVEEFRDRALEDSRRAIEALRPSADEPLHVALERHGARLAVECGLEVRVSTRCATGVSPEVRTEVLRIVAEAVRNAAHHGGARHVRVDVVGPPLSVRVMDDGSGFVSGASSGFGVAGYGLIAMRERAEQVGGQLNVESVRGAGTLVQVVLP